MTTLRSPSYSSRLRLWMRGLEPRLLNSLNSPMLQAARPWLDRHDVCSFNRRPLARGVAIGAFCGLIPGPLQIPSTLALCAWWRGNAIAGAITTFYTNPLTIVPLYMLGFQIGALLLPGTQDLPSMSAAMANGSGLMQGLAEWVQALGWPLLVGLPVLGLVLAALGYAVVQTLWLLPVLGRLHRLRQHRARAR